MTIEAAPEAPAEPTVSSNEEIAQDPLFDKLAETVTGLVAETTTEAKPEDAAEAKSDPGEEDPETPAEDDWDDLGDDKPWTAERHKKVADQHRSDRRKISSMLATLGKREKKLKGKVETFRTEKQQIALLTQRMMNDAETLRTGTGEQAVAALGRLAQRDPHQLYEAMSLAMLGKAPQKSAENAVIAELKAEIAALKEDRKTEREQQTESQQVNTAQAHVREVLQAKEEWPLLAARAAEAPAQVGEEFWTYYVQQSRSAGRWLDVDAVADRVERTLRRKMPSHQAKQNGATGSGPDREQETRAVANPEQAQSPPRSLSPSLSATSGGARRVQTEQELEDEFVRNAPPGFFEQFGSFG